jgi:hypothetical protein
MLRPEESPDAFISLQRPIVPVHFPTKQVLALLGRLPVNLTRSVANLNIGQLSRLEVSLLKFIPRHKGGLSGYDDAEKYALGGWLPLPVRSYMCSACRQLVVVVRRKRGMRLLADSFHTPTQLGPRLCCSFFLHLVLLSTAPTHWINVYSLNPKLYYVSTTVNVH